MLIQKSKLLCWKEDWFARACARARVGRGGGGSDRLTGLRTHSAYPSPSTPTLTRLFRETSSPLSTSLEGIFKASVARIKCFSTRQQQQHERPEDAAADSDDGQQRQRSSPAWLGGQNRPADRMALLRGSQQPHDNLERPETRHDQGKRWRTKLATGAHGGNRCATVEMPFAPHYLSTCVWRFFFFFGC